MGERGMEQGRIRLVGEMKWWVKKEDDEVVGVRGLGLGRIKLVGRGLRRDEVVDERK